MPTSDFMTHLSPLPCAVQIAGILFCASFGFQGIGRAAVEVTPQRIEETRALVFKEDNVSRTPSVLKLVLALDGPDADSATQYGRVKIEEAVDNTGASLIRSADAFHDPSKFRDYENAFFRNSRFHEKSDKSKPQVELDLASPARAVIKIARLRGSLELSLGGKTNTVKLGSLNSPGKKTVPTPDGSPVSIAFTVPDGAKVRSLNLEITGDENALASVEMIDASGKRVSTGISKWSLNGGPARQSLDLTRPLDGAMELVARIVTDRKYIKVPFDLRDIPLP